MLIRKTVSLPSLDQYAYDPPGNVLETDFIITENPAMTRLKITENGIVANVGIEPKTFALLARRSNQLS